MVSARAAAVVVWLGIISAGCKATPTDVSEAVRTASGPASPPLPLDAAVSAGTLPNGVSYVIRRTPNSWRATRLALVVDVGSLRERDDERGFAHFVEHLAFDASQRFGALVPTEVLSRHGASLGADANGETRHAHTQYFLTLKDAQPAELAEALDVLAGWASSLRFEPLAVERQRSIVLAELADLETAHIGLLGQVNRFVTEGFGYKGRGPLGVVADLQAATPQRLEEFYRRWYVPERFTVVASGELDVAAITSSIERRFMTLAGTPAPAPVTPADGSELQHESPPFSPIERVLLTSSTGERMPPGFVAMVLQLPSSGLRTEDDYRTGLLDRYLCALLEERWRDPPSSGRFECKVMSPGPELVQLMIHGHADPQALKRSIEALLEELNRVAAHGALASELARLAPSLQEVVSERARVTDLTEVSRQLVAFAVDRQGLLGLEEEQALAARLLPEVDSQQLQQRARAWQSESRRLIAVVRSDADDSLPSEAALSELVRAARERPVAPPREPEPVPDLLTTLPAPGAITHTESIEEIGVVRWQLANGAELVFKRGRRGGGGALLAISPAGPRAQADETPWNGWYAPQIVARSGAGAHDAASLARRALRTTTKVSVNDEITASSSVVDLEATLQLVHLYLTAPRRDPLALAALQDEMRAPPTPEQRFLNARYPEVDAAAIAPKLDLDLALQAYRARFGDLAGATLVMVADLEPEAARVLVERYIASLPGTAQDRTVARKDAVTEPVRGARSNAGRGVKRVRVPGRPGAQSRVVLEFSGTVPQSPEGRMAFAALNVHLHQRLRAVLREEIGGIYDVDLSSRWNGERSSLQIRFDCKPEDVDELKRTTLAEVRRIQQPGLSPADLQVLRESYAARFPAAFTNDAFWLEQLAHAQTEGTDPRRILELPKLASQLDRAMIAGYAKRFMPLDHYQDAVWSAANTAEALSPPPAPR